MSLGTPNGVLIMVDGCYQAKIELNCHQLVLSFNGRNVKLEGFTLLPQHSSSDFSELVTELSTHRIE